MRSVDVRFWCVAIATCVGISAAVAQPKLTRLSPEWIQRGASLTVEFTGENLGSVTGFVFVGETGLSAAVLAATNAKPSIGVEASVRGIEAVAPPSSDRSKLLRVLVTAEPTAPLGLREVRAVGPNGISSPLNITVGAVPEIAEAEPNNTLEQAQAVFFPAVISGVIQSATEVDQFRFKAQKGEALVFEVMAQRTGSPLDSSLAILDSSGRELMRDEDSRGFDSVLEFSPPADGEYVLQLRDFQYRGGGDYRYRVFAGTLPFVDYVFPFGAQRGKPVEMVVVGRNVQGAERVTLNIAPDAPLGRQEIRLNTPRGLSNPIQFDVRDWPEVVEKEPNEGTNANVVSLPIVINGRIGASADVDRFSFKAPSDGKWIAEVEARRFGSQLDAVLTLHSGETLLAQNDDASGLDARIEFEAKKDTDYTLSVRDLTGKTGGNFGYRLIVRPPSPPVAPTLAAKFFPDAVRLNRAGRTRVRCEVVRQGFDAPVRIVARDLPPGVSSDAVIVPSGKAEADLFLTAAPDARMGSLPLRISATAVSGGRELVAEALAIAPEASERTFKQGFVSVLETAPFTVDALTLATAVDQLQPASVDVLVTRSPGFAGDVKLSAVGFSGGREPISKNIDVKELVVKADSRTAQLKLTPKVNSELGVRQVVIRAEAMHQGQLVIEHSQPIALTVTQIPFVLSPARDKLALTIPRSATTPSEDASFKLKVERRGFSGEIPLTVAGLPKGISVTGTNIAANAAEATLVFAATDQAKPGTNATFTIQGAALFNDRVYRHRTAPVRLQLTLAPDIAVTNSPAAVP